MNNNGTTFIKNLNVGDVFTLNGETTLYLCQSVSVSSDGTRIGYRSVTAENPTEREFVRRGLSTVFVYA